MTTPVTSDVSLSATHSEIRQQPGAWRELRDGLVRRGGELAAFLEPVLAREDLRIVFTGAGTSAFIGDIAAEALRPVLGRRVDAVATTDLVADPRGALAEPLPVLLVSFARSGNSPESLAATRLVDRLAPQAHHLVVTCNEQGQLAREHQGAAGSFVLLLPEQTHDRGFAMTSSFSTMLLAALLAFDPAGLGAVDALAAASSSLIDRAGEVEALLDSAPHRVVHLGSGPLKGLAQESALKLLELTAGRVAAFHDTPLGFRHGPKSIVDDRTLVVVHASADPYTAQYDADIVAELRADHPGRVVHLGADGGFAVPGLDGLPDGLRAVALATFSQLLALGASVRQGCDPDNPFPDGTVNRVVQGVRIHELPVR
ncbi:SIS domain-containing protein [Kineococcus rhizosphaerae]|uniref:Galactosamine 6-phosphate isomerase AgaS n=1 Tax=Kineococcus rhizosphaerae TaxID=559628 RepID=A0A2T0R378_9ACTN|nr:SIS domain-containing protein [Kineococcus rhizosphaerae]PRY14509.1 galactosamine 6-phosphate isomerase AgaS [Kineococcus rhizosphaerae]